ncbi:MAG: hypothetical protein ACU84Q_11745, partial [Gammaproteobacteria bacterium]
TAHWMPIKNTRMLAKDKECDGFAFSNAIARPVVPPIGITAGIIHTQPFAQSRAVRWNRDTDPYGARRGSPLVQIDRVKLA